MKLVLLIPEAHIVENKGYQFIETVLQFMRCFNIQSEFNANISLVVSKVASHKKLQQINNSITKILDQNQKVTPEQKTLITKLQNTSLSIFYKPKSEGEIQLDHLLLNFSLSEVNYLKSKPDMTNMRVSPQAKECCDKLLDTAKNNFNKILELTIRAIVDATKCLNSNSNNIFTDNHDMIRDLVPSKMDYKIVKNYNDSEHFPHLEHLLGLQKVLSHKQVESIEQGIELLQKSLEVFVEYTDKDNIKLKHQIQDYSYVLLQQFQYIRFFSEICEKELPAPQWLSQVIGECNNKVRENLEYQIKTMTIGERNPDPEYYYKAIKYLNNYPDSTVCNIFKAKAFGSLASIAEQKGDNNTVLNCYLKTIEFNHELAPIYDKVGKLFYDNKEYSKAIQCYKVVNNTFKIKKCFKEWLKHNPENPDIMMKEAEYLESIGLFEKAKACYHNVFSISQNEKVKADAWQKIGNILTSASSQGQNFIERAKVCDFYNFELVDDNFIKSLIGEENFTDF